MNAVQSTPQKSQQRYPYVAWLVIVTALLGASWQAAAADEIIDHSASTPVAFAQVLSVDPITEIVREPLSREVCYQPTRPNNARTPAIVGGILGGLVGNQFGSGSGRTATTIAGAALGASIGADRARRNSERHTGRHCEVKTEYRQIERVSGYRVSYELEGQTYVTETKDRPGDVIAVDLERDNS